MLRKLGMRMLWLACVLTSCLLWSGVAHANTCSAVVAEAYPGARYGWESVSPPVAGTACDIHLFVPDAEPLSEPLSDVQVVAGSAEEVSDRLFANERLEFILQDLTIVEHELIELEIVQAPREVGEWLPDCNIEEETIQVPFRSYRLRFAEPLPADLEIAVIVNGDFRSPAALFTTTSDPDDLNCPDPEALLPDAGACAPPLPCPYEDAALDPEDDPPVRDAAAMPAAAGDAAAAPVSAGDDAGSPQVDARSRESRHDGCRAAAGDRASPWRTLFGVSLLALLIRVRARRPAARACTPPTGRACARAGSPSTTR